MSTKHPREKKESLRNEKILLAVLPFWTPQIPPLGIACLKSFLQQHHYHVKTIDFNVMDEFNRIRQEYFELLKEYIPGDKRGNFYNIGGSVLANHMMAHLNYSDEREYCKLVNILIEKTFFCGVDKVQVGQLNRKIDDFYTILEKYLVHLLEKDKPGVLGLSVYSGTLAASLFVFKRAKEKDPRIKTIMGGGIFADQLERESPNFEIFLRETPYIDKIIVGEGEILLLKLLKGELPGSQRVYTRNDIKGKTLYLGNADVPDFSDFNLQAYPSIASYASRSCPHQCRFCSETIQWGKYRKKSARQVVGELNRLYQKYGIQLFFMGDSLLNPIVSELANEIIKSGASFYWDGYLKADKFVCNIENTLLWRQGGFYRARLGIESGSQKILDLMNKKITPGKIKQAIAALTYCGIKTTTYWVIGYPGETEEDFRQTLELLEELKENIYEAECNPFNYFLTGQGGSEDWHQKNKAIPLYPGNTLDMLMIQTWHLDGKPTRRQVHTRMIRFAQHCKKLGIPNPYSINEISRADTRWQKLHKNAVPCQVDFKNRGIYINECRRLKKTKFLKPVLPENGDFGF